MFIKNNLNKIITGDALKKLEGIPDKSVDMVFADPPYNLQLQKPLLRSNGAMFQGVGEEWDKFENFEEYDSFCHNWLKRM